MQVGLHESLSVAQLPIAQTVILSQHDIGLKPEPGFRACGRHVYVHPGLFTGEEVKPEGATAKDGWAHGQSSTIAA
jgi:hypothetical protein